ncbi:MAG: GerMN domain-containing protein [Stigonema ocellatum SAG 48.90 = DSM 106950]|nr:GerMN domain-containing protein [Stigonema ocellatum SAG 48.90 = DSM 106950]
MNSSKKYIIPFMVMAIVTYLSSCSDRHTPSTTRNNGELFPTPTIPQIIEPPLLKKSLNQSADTDNTINITLYTSDPQCLELIPEQASVSDHEPVTSAVGKILEQLDTADSSLSGYRVSVKNGVATVDLRSSPNSPRQLTSLSSCEQFALFGSLRKTLTSNTQWNIKEVRFTELGKAIQ